MPRSRSSQRWLAEHNSDLFVKEARDRGYRSRAYFKLKELDQRYRLFASGNAVLDLGAAPGGWSQYVAQKVGKNGMVISVDLLEMEPLSGVLFMQGDFTDIAVENQVAELLADRKVAVVCSDMAPNMSGQKVVDQARAMNLADLALEAAKRFVSEALVVKLFQGVGHEAFLSEVKSRYAKVAVSKPEASRDRSREVYLVARGRKI